MNRSTRSFRTRPAGQVFEPLPYSQMIPQGTPVQGSDQIASPTWSRTVSYQGAPAPNTPAYMASPTVAQPAPIGSGPSGTLYTAPQNANPFAPIVPGTPAQTPYNPTLNPAPFGSATGGAAPNGVIYPNAQVPLGTAVPAPGMVMAPVSSASEEGIPWWLIALFLGGAVGIVYAARRGTLANPSLGLPNPSAGGVDRVTRYIGRLKVSVGEYHGGYDGRWYYRGYIQTPSGKKWHFSDLASGVGGYRGAGGSDSPVAYDHAAVSAVSFASYYTTHNRGDDLPDWAPPAEVADEIENESYAALAEGGNENRFYVRRSRNGKQYGPYA